MMTSDEKTLAFSLWPHMLVLEGEAKSIGTLIASLYHDKAIPREMWNASHTETSRKTHAQNLIARGSEQIRQGLGARTNSLLAIVEVRARQLGLRSTRVTKGR